MGQVAQLEEHWFGNTELARGGSNPSLSIVLLRGVLFSSEIRCTSVPVSGSGEARRTPPSRSNTARHAERPREGDGTGFTCFSVPSVLGAWPSSPCPGQSKTRRLSRASHTSGQSAYDRELTAGKTAQLFMRLHGTSRLQSVVITEAVRGKIPKSLPISSVCRFESCSADGTMVDRLTGQGRGDIIRA
jgi:hypothetical protein